jgi:hypothetical protein
MMKQLTIVAAVVFAVACKTDAPPQQSAAPAGEDTGAKARSAKIDVKPVQPPPAPPALPAPPAASTDSPAATVPPPGDNPMPRADWRRRRDARLDANGDGVVSGEERDAAMHERMTNMRTRLDTNGDGKVSPDEMAGARGRMRFDDPAALDTNHDGDISADELAAGFRARREQWRGTRPGPGPSPVAPGDGSGTP